MHGWPGGIALRFSTGQGKATAPRFRHGLAPRQDHGRLLGDHGRSLARNELGDEADPLGGPVRFVPRNQHTVGRPQFRVALHLGQLLWREHILACWRGGGLVGRVFLERINDQGAVDLDRSAFVGRVEQQTAAETT